MIRIDRGPEPPGFVQRSTDWQKRFVAALKQDPNLTPAQFWSKVRREMLVDAETLVMVFNGKCAFCESKMGHVASPHIEHYRPKSKFPDYMFHWDNWLLSCGKCNDKKWAHFPDCKDQPCLINPATEEPNEHLDFIRAQVLDSTDRGKETIKLIGLDRTPLIEARANWLMEIDAFLLLCASGTPDELKEAREMLIWAMQPNAPYTAMTRSYLRKVVPNLANPPIPHPVVQLQNPREQMLKLVEAAKENLKTLG